MKVNNILETKDIRLEESLRLKLKNAIDNIPDKARLKSEVDKILTEEFTNSHTNFPRQSENLFGKPVADKMADILIQDIH